MLILWRKKMKFEKQVKYIKQRYRPIRKLIKKKSFRKKAVKILVILFIILQCSALVIGWLRHNEEKRKLQTDIDLMRSSLELNKSEIKKFKQDLDAKEDAIREKIKAEEELKNKVEELEVELQAKIENEQKLALEPIPYGQTGGRGAVNSSTTGKVSSGNVGNMYAPGNCTWYVYNRKPNIGSFWGDASQWVNSASRDGFAVGAEPASGAIGVERGLNHVVFIESDNGDGTVTVSEMNYGGLYVTNTRTVPANTFTYIYA